MGSDPSSWIFTTSHFTDWHQQSASLTLSHFYVTQLINPKIWLP